MLSGDVAAIFAVRLYASCRTKVQIPYTLYAIRLRTLKEQLF